MFKRLFALICLTMFAALALSGCSSMKSLVSAGNAGGGNGNHSGYGGRGDYSSALSKYSRKADIYNKLNTVMYIRATYCGKPFITAYVNKYAEYYMLSGKMYREKSDKSLSNLKQYIKFFVSVYTPKKGYNDLSSDRSIWMVYLKNNNNESVMPLSIKPAREKRVFLKRFFPYVNDWSKQYIIKFPVYFDKKTKAPFITSNTKWVELIITGVNGTAVLKWDLLR